MVSLYWLPKPAAIVALGFLAFQLYLEVTEYQVTQASKERVQEFSILWHPDDAQDYQDILDDISDDSPDPDDINNFAGIAACMTYVKSCGDVGTQCPGPAEEPCCPDDFTCKDISDFDEVGGNATSIPICFSDIIGCGLKDTVDDWIACSGMMWEFADDDETYPAYKDRCEENDLCVLSADGYDDLEALVPVIIANLVLTCFELAVKLFIIFAEFAPKLRENIAWFVFKTSLEFVAKLGTMGARIALIVVITNSNTPEWIREVVERRCASPLGSKVFSEMNDFLEKILALGTVDLVINSLQLVGELGEKIKEGYDLTHKKD